MFRSRRVLALTLLLALATIVVGCDGDAGDGEIAIEPTIGPPLVAEGGILRAGVDMGYPPFAGEGKGRVVGLDVDVAAAIAETLGLRLDLVDTGPDGYAAALIDGEVDIALGAIPITEAVLTDVSFAGSYALDGPALFSATETTGSIGSLAGKTIGAQEGSLAYWTLIAYYGEEVVTGHGTLREAFEKAADGDLDLVAGDAIVGAYIGREYPSVHYVVQIEDAVPLGVAVAKDADDLETAIREALDTLSADGTLVAIRAKWLGSLPDLNIAPME